MGLVVSGVFLRDRVLVHRIRSIAFALLTPFYFIKAGLYVALPAIWAGAPVIAVLLLLKLLAKGIGVWPTGAFFRLPRRLNAYTTLLMSTGLTFGTISALYGLSHGIVSREQYSFLVAVVIGSAVVPTLIAGYAFLPRHLLSEAPVPDEEIPQLDKSVPCAASKDENDKGLGDE
jgi:Kef-type K+ transport system membrane component KefB